MKNYKPITTLDTRMVAGNIRKMNEAETRRTPSTMRGIEPVKTVGQSPKAGGDGVVGLSTKQKQIAMLLQLLG